MQHQRGERSLKRNMAFTLLPRIEAIDSCLILRMLRNDLPEQSKKATELLLSGKDFYVSEAVISEVIYVMKKNNCKRSSTIDRLTTLLHNAMFVYDKKFFDPLFVEYVNHPSLSFEDLVIAKRAEEKNSVPLWTFDKKFAKQMEVARLLD